MTDWGKIVGDIAEEAYYKDDAVILFHADCRDILPKLSDINLVLTDPPYKKEFSYVWDYLAEYAPIAMKANSFLVTLVGHYQLLDVINKLNKKLSYYWIATCENNNCPILHGFYVKVNFKPILIFRNGKAKPARVWRDRFNIAANVAKWKDAKNAHPWGQAESIFYEPIDAFSPQNGIICDPFIGGGSVAVAAKNLGRKCIGIEIEKKYLKIAVERLKQECLALV